MDNAAIHASLETIDMIDFLFKAAGIKLVLLPKYSPELNPYKLVFSQVKTFLRNHYSSTYSLWFNIATACATINITFSKLSILL